MPTPSPWPVSASRAPHAARLHLKPCVQERAGRRAWALARGHLQVKVGVCFFALLRSTHPAAPGVGAFEVGGGGAGTPPCLPDSGPGRSSRRAADSAQPDGRPLTKAAEVPPDGPASSPLGHRRSPRSLPAAGAFRCQRTRINRGTAGHPARQRGLTFPSACT